ncbi:hypothetical protein E2C01_011357 [Portunus trituberculatus]|uniref:Uncharacterized protein n=1 Tax=Portunus trituberculatus TaxID=210409 RepID=A0A5B7DAZ4_PORTR|nr:hypothetical protein [Portunus trituberculatus]
MYHKAFMTQPFNTNEECSGLSEPLSSSSSSSSSSSCSTTSPPWSSKMVVLMISVFGVRKRRPLPKRLWKSSALAVLREEGGIITPSPLDGDGEGCGGFTTGAGGGEYPYIPGREAFSISTAEIL